MTQHCVVMHTYIYQIGPVIFRLVRSQHNDELYLLGDNKSITNEEVPVLSPITANFIGQLSLILTNNLNLKAPTCDRYMFTHLHFCFSKIGGVFWTLWGKYAFSFFFHIFMNRFIVYYISKLTSYRKIFATIYNMPGPVSIYILQKHPETVQRGSLNLKVNVEERHLYYMTPHKAKTIYDPPWG